MQIYNNYTTQKMKFPITDLVTFTEEILNVKLHFFVQCVVFKESSFVGICQQLKIHSCIGHESIWYYPVILLVAFSCICVFISVCVICRNREK